MSDQAKSIRKFGIVWILILVLVAWFLVPWRKVLPESTYFTTAWLKLDNSFLYVSSQPTIRDSLIVFEHIDAEGNYSWTVLLTPEFDKCLPEIIDAYNSDPSTTVPVDEEYIRQYIAEELRFDVGNYNVSDPNKHEYTAGANNRYAPFDYFYYWLGSNANLVYAQTTVFYREIVKEGEVLEEGEEAEREYYSLEDGSHSAEELILDGYLPLHLPGDAVDFKVSNYDYLMSRSGDVYHASKRISLSKLQSVVYEWDYLA